MYYPQTSAELITMLQEHDIKPTQQRLQIAGVLFAKPQHLSADQVLDQVNKLTGGYVSKATVSHVINNTRYVEEETRQRVLEEITALGYRPNALARSLTTHRTGIIGMVISDASNLFFGEMLLGVEQVLRPNNYGLIVCNTNEVLEQEDHYLELLLNQRVDGIIAAATSQHGQ